MILLLSGTSEGRILSARLRAEGLPFVASVTTPEARQLFAGIDRRQKFSSPVQSAMHWRHSCASAR